MIIEFWLFSLCPCQLKSGLYSQLSFGKVTGSSCGSILAYSLPNSQESAECYSDPTVLMHSKDGQRSISQGM